MSTTVESEEIRYGNLRRPKLPGIMGMSAVPSLIILLGAVIMMVLIFVVNLWVAAVFAVLLLGAVLPEAIPTADGVGRYSKWIGKQKFKKAKKTHKNVLVQGLTGFLPDGDCRLPGVAAAVELSSAQDVHGRGFGLIHWRKSDLYSVVIQCFPSGSSALDKSVIDFQVAQWAAWMGQLNTIGEVVGAAVVVETAPDSGQRLQRAIDRGRSDVAPEFSVRMAEEMKESSRAGAPMVTTRITITFDAKLKGDPDGDDADAEAKVRSREEMAAVIGDVLPTLTGSLDATGAGSSAYPCSAQEIVDFTRVAYDPAVAVQVEEAQYEGGTGLSWSDVGPITAVNHFDRYQHDTAFSRTWQMRETPRGMFFSKTLQDLLAPHRDVARKRVVLMYRPEAPDRSSSIAENDVTAARLVASQNPRTRAAHRIAVEAAEKTAEQQAMGSPLIRVGLLVTVTVLDPAHMPRASRVVISTLAPQARLRMRLPRGAQDSAFVAALPLGMVPRFHAGLSTFTDGL